MRPPRTRVRPDADPDAADRPTPTDQRSLLQVLIGAFVGGAIAGGLAALLGSGAVASVVFGFLIGVLFLWMDLRSRERAEGPPPPGT